jgi:hypothetical protein
MGERRHAPAAPRAARWGCHSRQQDPCLALGRWATSGVTATVDNSAAVGVGLPLPAHIPPFLSYETRGVSLCSVLFIMEDMTERKRAGCVLVNLNRALRVCSAWGRARRTTVGDTTVATGRHLAGHTGG